MNKYYPFLIIAIALAAVFLIVRPYWHTSPAAKPNQTPLDAENISSTPSVATGLLQKAPIPTGSQTYQIMQAASAMPKIVQATIDPVNADLGQMQTLTVIVSDPNPITSVVAAIQTDNGTTTVSLALVGPAALNDVIPQRYFVNEQNQLVFANPDNGSGKGNGNVALAAQGDETYSAQWKVEGTHVARYSTVFTATDAQGNVNSARIGWTDAVCSWNGTNNNNGATTSISSVFGSGGCQFLSNETDGVENGNLLIDAPVTLAQGSSLVINSGHALSFSGSGQLSIPTTAPLGQLVFSDMYCSAGGWTLTYSSSINGSPQEARSALSSSVFPGQTAYFTTPAAMTNYGANTYNYNCAATVTQEYTNVGQVTSAPSCSMGGCVSAQYTPGWYQSVPGCGATSTALGLVGQNCLNKCIEFVAQAVNTSTVQACN